MNAAKEQEAQEKEIMSNGVKGRGMFRKSRNSSQQVLNTRGIPLLLYEL